MFQEVIAYLYAQDNNLKTGFYIPPFTITAFLRNPEKTMTLKY